MGGPDGDKIVVCALTSASDTFKWKNRSLCKSYFETNKI